MEKLDFIEKGRIHYKENVLLAELTGKNQSGCLSLVLYPEDEDSLIEIVTECRNRNLSYDIFGGLSNTYLASSFLRDVVIITTHMREIITKDNSVVVACGYNLTKLSRELSAKGITGYEGFIGIPGTVGAAAINNSGAFRSSMEKVVKRVKVFDSNGQIKVIEHSELKYGVRTSCLKSLHEYIVLSVELDISDRKLQGEIDKTIEEQTKYRKKYIDGKHKSLGSVFSAYTIRELYKRHQLAMNTKKIINQPLKWIFHSKRLNTWMDFLFLGVPHLAKHCDSMNRFVWKETTKEQDFFHYIEIMQRLADNKLELEVEIRR